jgi:hypothetical protein
MSFEYLPKPVRDMIYKLPKPEPKIESVVLGFGFRARSGKDTAVAEIVKQRSSQYDVRAYSFAMALKQEVNQAAEAAGGMERLFDPMEFIQENGNAIVLPDWVKFDPNPPMDDPLCPLGKQRLLLQFWGTEFRRAVNGDYWVGRLASIIEKERPQVALISDMRFPNEKAFVEKYGQSVRVDRVDLPPLKGSAGIHPSELALANVPDWDWGMILKNNGTLEEFKQKSVEAFDELMMLQQAS